MTVRFTILTRQQWLKVIAFTWRTIWHDIACLASRQMCNTDVADTPKNRRRVWHWSSRLVYFFSSLLLLERIAPKLPEETVFGKDKTFGESFFFFNITFDLGFPYERLSIELYSTTSLYMEHFFLLNKYLLFTSYLKLLFKLTKACMAWHFAKWVFLLDIVATFSIYVVCLE